MRINRLHLIYLLAFWPGLLGLFLQVLLGAYFHIAVRVAVLIIIAIALLQFTRHFASLPKAHMLYGELKPIGNLVLPQALVGDDTVGIYTSKTMDRLYDGHATVDVLSCLLERSGERKIVISSAIVDQKPELLEVLAAGAYVRHKRASQAKDFFVLVFTFLFMINFLMIFYLGDVAFLARYGALMSTILMPMLTAGTLIGTLLAWSKLNLRSDQQTDRILCDYYPAKQIMDGIALEEEIEGRGEKERYQQINSEDVRQRFEAIEKYQQ